MAGAFSGHLLNAFNGGGAPSSSSTIVTSGAMSFDARAHGTPAPSFRPSFSPSPSPFGFTPFSDDSTTARQIATLQAKLNKKLGPEYISQRPGPSGGPKLTYAEGWKIINLANDVFGFNGWSSSIVSLATDYIDHNEESKRYNVGVTAIVRVTLKDGAYHEDVGYGALENSKSKAAALDKCKKEAITDALKRTLRNFGNLLGNCLYDKSYTQEIVKIKVPPAKLDKNELYRHPEFEERAQGAPSPAPRGQVAIAETPSAKQEEPHVKAEPETPIAYVPRHLRQEMAAAAQQAQAKAPVRVAVMAPQKASTPDSGATEAPTNHGLPGNAPKPNGLATPVQTPGRVQRPPAPQAPPPRPAAILPLTRTPSGSKRSVSFAPAPSNGTADLATSETGQTNVSNASNDDDDAFPLSTQDDAFLSTVDLGEGDLGRPIDFGEGTGGMSMLDAPEPVSDSAAQSPVVLPQPRPQVRDRAGSGLGAGPSSGAPPRLNVRGEVPAQPTAKPPSATSSSAQSNVSGSGGQQSQSITTNVASASASTPSVSSTRAAPPAQDPKQLRVLVGGSAGSGPIAAPSSGWPPKPAQPTAKPPSAATSASAGPSTGANSAQQSRSGPPNATPASSTRPAPLVQDPKHPVGSSYYPPGMKPPVQHTPKPVSPACVRAPNDPQNAGPANPNALKRTADMMQAGSSTSSRPPIQGMGLAQRQQQHQQQQNVQARRPPESNASDGHDSKRFKR